jgi:hypothetical protein
MSMAHAGLDLQQVMTDPERLAAVLLDVYYKA